jgi:hypothetical protein
MHDWSRDVDQNWEVCLDLYDWSHIFQPELVKRPESRPQTGVGHTTGIVSSNRIRANDRSRAFL